MKMFGCVNTMPFVYCLTRRTTGPARSQQAFPINISNIRKQNHCTTSGSEDCLPEPRISPNDLS